LPKEFKEVRIVYSEFKGHLAYGDASLAGPSKVGPDKWGNKSILRSTFKSKKLFKEIEVDQEAQIIFELQAPHNNEYAGLGWSWVKLFAEEDGELKLNQGKWHLPIYTGTTRPDLTYQGANEMDKAPGVSLCVKLGFPGDKLTKIAGGPETNIVDYLIPNYHQDLY